MNRVFIRQLETKRKIEELKKQNKPVGCLSCLGRVDDGFHEYDDKHEVWYCPSLEEE
jgi:hypothetical protein